MDIWAKRVGRIAHCRCGCGQTMAAGEIAIVGSTRKQSHKDGKMWIRKLYWIPDHWLAQAVQSVDRTPHIESRGRKRLLMSPEDKVARQKIIMKKASVVQRIRKLRENGDGELSENNLGKLMHYGELINQYKVELEVLGGVPKSWE